MKAVYNMETDSTYVRHCVNFIIYVTFYMEGYFMGVLEDIIIFMIIIYMYTQ